ncbi:hypothetical protein [Alloalcanivorax profundimaris]|uniref:hypothetical protein n=1 Tax=Alloalcanivorax profundimaris TaxID=2735259 RepID=UPI001891A345|nr:hypothetical protein [Alloalcanivorax profundimaris]
MKTIYLERISPYILSSAGCFLWWRLGLVLPAGDAILSSSLTLGAIITGFLATAKAIVMTLDSPIMKKIRQTDYSNDLVSYLGQAIWLSFSFCILSIVGFFVSTEDAWFGLVWIFIGLASAGAFIRVTNIMLKIIKHHPE